MKLEGSTKFIDVYIPDTKVIIEQKSIDIDLSKEVSQSGGECLTPYGFDKSMSESDIVAALFKMYQALTEK